MRLLTALACLLLACSAFAQVSENLLKNPSFEEGFESGKVPAGWSLYGGLDQSRTVLASDSAQDGVLALILVDEDQGREIGITQAIPAQPNLTYEASVMVRRVEGALSSGSYMQLRFLPSGEFRQVSLAARSTVAWNRIATRGTAPEGTTGIQLYLYSHANPTPKVMVDNVAIVSGVEPPFPAPPPPVPPVYDKLKDLRLNTALVAEGKPAATIIAPAGGRYDAQASRIQAAIRDITGVEVPIATDDSPAAAVPLAGNLIALGNRNTSKLISQLYDLYYVILDLKYPGPEGYNVRTLHDPFGNGFNVAFAGGSDDLGVAAAADVLVGKLREAGGQAGALTVGRLMDIKLGTGVTIPTDLKQFETWEASRGYGSSGYFGWCSISKRAAMYYMTGEPFHAREFLRLSFPDAKTKDELAETDGEMVENKDDPLAGFYHYNSHMAVLYWDLIEDSPVFSDEERLKVTNAFSRQLNHRRDEGVYGLTDPPEYVSSRHGQWSAMSLYCLGRYLENSYHDPVWSQCVRGAKNAFGSLHEHAWVSGESDNLFWLSTGTAPVLAYMVITGDRKPLENGVLGELLKAQEMLISGQVPDWALNSAAASYLTQAAYLTGDGRWMEYLRRTGIDTNVFRLGQSYWPDPSVEPLLPADLVGKWSIYNLPEPAWVSRGTGFAPEESMYFGSFRSAADASGDFILLDGFNGASRNPYHTFAILEQRIAGYTLSSQAYRNQVLTRADGMVEPQVAMDAALKYADVVGGTAAVVADVPNAAYCDWQRTLAQRIGRYAVVVDDLGFRTDSENMEVQTLWEYRGASWNKAHNALEVRVAGAKPLPPGWKRFRALEARMSCSPAGPEGTVRLDSLDIFLLRATKPGDWLEMPFDVPTAFDGEVYADLLNYVDRGIVRVLLDGQEAVARFDHTASAASSQRLLLTNTGLAAGEHRLRVEVVDRRDSSEKAFVGLGGVILRPAGAMGSDEAVRFEIRPSDLVDTRLAGGFATMQWRGKVRESEHRRFFSLIAMGPETTDSPLACVRLTDSAAALALPTPALAVVGKHQATEAQFAVVAEDHLFGIKLTSAGMTAPVLRSDKPVDVDWDFVTGLLSMVAAEPATVTLALDASATPTLDENAVPVAGGQASLTLPAGRSQITGAIPAIAALTADLRQALAQGQDSRVQLMAEASAQTAPTAPSLAAAFATQVGGEALDMVEVPSAQGPLVCVAEGNTIHVLGRNGAEVRQMATDGKIRVLHWWPEAKLLLAGCVDEKVIAFDEDGNRKWEFVSVMDPAVFRAAKQYWFKTAPGHEGIHGLFTGQFVGDKTQAFVGSACTLEILDENGQLVKRLPVFWGPGHRFQIIPRQDGTRDLLIAREPTDGEALAVVNSESLTETGRRYHNVPSGHSYVGGWACMSRDHIYHQDLDGDGNKEIISEINGTWNRVTVWDEDGTARYSAVFGPGDPIPTRNMRDLALADLDGDGKQEIITGTSSGLVVALDCECRKLWSKLLPSPPTVLATVTPPGANLPVIVAGCEDGTVVQLSSAGELQKMDRVEGRPTRILTVETDGQAPIVVLATNKGQVKAFTP